jgi:hypothetical protein
MCRVTVDCHCHTHNDGGAGWVGVAALAVLGVLAVPVIVATVQAALDLLTAVVVAVMVAVGIVVAGWIVKNVAVAVIEERALRRHNERMTQIHPHLRAHLHHTRRPAGAPVEHVRAIPTRPPRPIPPVRIYPTPRSDLAARRDHRRAV